MANLVIPWPKAILFEPPQTTTAFKHDNPHSTPYKSPIFIASISTLAFSHIAIAGQSLTRKNAKADRPRSIITDKLLEQKARESFFSSLEREVRFNLVFLETLQ